ncbi:sigma-70 family RNA polymerase sigma factor [Candidatus Poribacteria bacterium]|nr:sigma-70 family RNA polymerase sigma factor [Candidatus Poribacteria bacterium]
MVKRYQGRAYGLAYSLVGNWTESQDLTQEAFIRAYVNLGNFREPAKFASWLRRIVFGTCIDWLRAFRPEMYHQVESTQDIDELERVVDESIQPLPDQLVKQEGSEVILAAIAQLPPKYRIPITKPNTFEAFSRKCGQVLAHLSHTFNRVRNRP